MGDLKKIMDLQNQLGKEKVEIEKNGVKVVVKGVPPAPQKIDKLESNGRGDDDIKEAINEAIKKSQELGAQKLQQMSGGLGGMFGK